MLKNMKARSTKSFNFGFALKEADLRRTIELSRGQLQKVCGDSAIKEDFTLTFFNGTIVENLDIEEVLAQENLGSVQIEQLDAKLTSGTGDDTALIELSFCNATRVQDRSDSPVSFKIYSSSRDWTFVTSSLIEERIVKVSRPFGWLLKALGEPWPYVLLIMTLVLATVYFIRYDTSESSLYSDLRLARLRLQSLEYATVFDPTRFPPSLSDYRVKFSEFYTPETTLLEKLEKKRPENAIDAFETFILIEQTKAEMEAEKQIAYAKWQDQAQSWLQDERAKLLAGKESQSADERAAYTSEIESLQKQIDQQAGGWAAWSFWHKLIASAVGIIAIPFLLWLLLQRFYPLYNFVWGDYLDVFDRNTGVLKVVFVVVIIGIVVSTIGGLIANRF